MHLLCGEIMNLKLSFPKGVNEDDVSFSLPFDIDGKAKKTSGHLTVTKDKLCVYENDELLETILTSDIIDIQVHKLIGCSMLCVKD